MGRSSKGWIGRSPYFALPLVGLAAAAWSATSWAALPSPDQLVPNTVARVYDVPRRAGTITRAEFRHALVLAAAAEGRRRAPKSHDSGYKRLKHRAVEVLLEAVWLKGQAAEMHIVVTRSQVSRALARLKKQSFNSAAEFRGFLKEARFTRRDLYERIELELLARRIQRRIANRAKSKSEAQKAFREFVAEFNSRWRGRTVCAPAYVTNRCSNRAHEIQILLVTGLPQLAGTFGLIGPPPGTGSGEMNRPSAGT